MKQTNTGVFTFLGTCLEEEFHVLVTGDAGPTDFGSLPVLLQAQDHASGLYEADAFAANFVTRAFLRASVMRGQVRLLPSGDWGDVAPPETRFRYAISPGKARHAGKILVMVYAVEPVHEDRREWAQTKITQGTLEEVERWAEGERSKTPARALGSTTRTRVRTTPIGAPRHAGC